MTPSRTERPPSFWELAVQATTNTRQGYNLLAPRFELTPYATPCWLVEACLARLDQLSPLDRSLACGLDLACGTGRAALPLARSCARVEGLDFSPRMLEQARRKAQEVPETDFDFQEADLATVRLREAFYDRIVTFGAWGHILPPWRRRFVEQCVKALKPGGVFATVTADPAHKLSRRWWYSVAFDNSLRLRNMLLGDPFHMYYAINDTDEVRSLFSSVGGVTIRLEPVPRRPHPELTLLVAVRSPEAN